MIIEFDLIYNFLVALFFVTSAFVLGISLKNKLTKSKPEQLPHNKTETNSKKESDPEAAKNKERTFPDDFSYKQFLNEAHNHAKKVIDETTETATNLILGSKQTNENIEANLDHILQQIAASDIRALKDASLKFDNDYKKVLTNLESEMQKMSVEIVEQTKNQYNEKLDEFMKTLTKNATDTQGIVDKKTAELINLAEVEISEYKKQKIANADEDIRKLIQKVYRDVLRVSIPENLHQDLIIKSLEDAKRDELFKV